MLGTRSRPALRRHGAAHLVDVSATSLKKKFLEPHELITRRDASSALAPPAPSPISSHHTDKLHDKIMSSLLRIGRPASESDMAKMAPLAIQAHDCLEHLRGVLLNQGASVDAAHDFLTMLLPESPVVLDMRDQSQQNSCTQSANQQTEIRFLPKLLRGCRVLIHEGANIYRVDNSKVGSAGKGLHYRMSKDMHSKDPESEAFAPWGTTVEGIDDGDGWVQVACVTSNTSTDCFLNLGDFGVAEICSSASERSVFSCDSSSSDRSSMLRDSACQDTLRTESEKTISTCASSKCAETNYESFTSADRTEGQLQYKQCSVSDLCVSSNKRSNCQHPPEICEQGRGNLKCKECSKRAIVRLDSKGELV